MRLLGARASHQRWDDLKQQRAHLVAAADVISQLVTQPQPPDRVRQVRQQQPGGRGQLQRAQLAAELLREGARTHARRCLREL